MALIDSFDLLIVIFLMNLFLIIEIVRQQRETAPVKSAKNTL